MKALDVMTPNKNYQILFEQSFIELSASIQRLHKSYSKIAIITDDQVGPLYTEEIVKALLPLNIEVVSYQFNHGEQNKNYQTINQFYEFLIMNHFDRKSLLIALGGGVTGDMVGFTAATYMRGIDFVQVPTSLLAQVDSSIGGKTGIDFNGYKNIVGAFYQPELVYINTSTLKTLPQVEFNSGMGEVIKHGFIMDASYVDFIESNIQGILSLDHTIISELIGTSCKIKSIVVSEDEREHGLRAILNYGHTIGHAIERLKNFEMLHGECVAIGILAAAHISLKLNQLNSLDYNRIKSIIESFNLPTKVTGLEVETVYNELFYDKKTSHQQLNFILLDSIGKCYQNKSLDQAIILEGIKSVLNEVTL
jgi:3-dehydroquinate synthase